MPSVLQRMMSSHIITLVTADNEKIDVDSAVSGFYSPFFLYADLVDLTVKFINQSSVIAGLVPKGNLGAAGRIISLLKGATACKDNELIQVPHVSGPILKKVSTLFRRLR